MRRHLLFIFAALAAAAVLAVGASGTVAARANAIAYVFNGRLLADPGATGNKLFVRVRSGNRPALRLLVGRSRDQLFSVDSSTEYLRWSNGVPTVVSEDNLAAGDVVTIRVRAERGSTLAQVESTAAKVVADRGVSPGRANKPLWLFVGRLTAPAANGRIPLHVTSGNWRGLHAMLGQSLDQTFSYDSHTIFILWQGRVPTVISPGQMKVGDRISVRIRAPRGSSLARLDSTPANHVGDHEPALPEG